MLNSLLLIALLPQVHYSSNGSPWNQRADSGPDAEVPGWFYNLGVTGIRCELIPNRPKSLLVRYVFPDSPAFKKIQADDLIVGVMDEKFKHEHQNGYGMNVFGAKGPISELAQAIDTSAKRKIKLNLLIERNGKEVSIDLRLRHQVFENSHRTKKTSSDRLPKLLDYLVNHQREDGSWGSPPHDTFAPLALMSSSKKKHRDAVVKNVRMHAKTTSAKDDSWLINWRYMSAGIVLSEFYLQTGEKWVLPELVEIYDFLRSSQYVDLVQLNPKSHETHPHAVPKTPLDSHGGWGHNPGFEGYGPISMLTAQGALVFALMARCGIDIDQEAHGAAYAFLRRASGDNFYVWYEDQAAGPKDWADMGRTGTAAIAFHMSPLDEEHHR
ncbi:MAG: PDZ domain-containing protein, partial [Planctomycetes bacterium]|nr:PDZ domain-containing protein [Planctomycetota bacterium]